MALIGWILSFTCLFAGLALRQDLHPAGRLDRDTTGLVLLTSDGRSVRRMLGSENAPARWGIIGIIND